VAADTGSTGWRPLSAPSRPEADGGGPHIRKGLAARLAVPRTPKEEAFLRLALTHTLSSAGDAMVTVAMAGSIFFTTNPNQARGKLVLALVLTMAPFAVVAPFLGPAIDRSSGGRRLMLVVAAAGRAVTCIYMATVLHNVLLYPCALVVLILSKSHAVAKSSLVPATVDGPADLVRAGGRLAVLAAVAGLAAGVPAAAVLELAHAAWVLRLAALVYAGGAVMAIRTRPAPPTELDPPDHIDEAVRSRGVSLAAWCQTTLRATSGFLTFAVAFVMRRSHAPAWWYGIIVAAALIGGFAGNMIGPSVRRVFGEERMLTSVLVLMAVAGLFTAQIDSRLGLTLLAFAAGLSDGMGQLAFDAIVQRDGSEGARGRSFARFEATFQLAWVGAALVPVALSIANWLACLLIAVAAGTTAVVYQVARHTSLRWRSARPPAPSGAAASGAAASGAAVSGATAPSGAAAPEGVVGGAPATDFEYAAAPADPGVWSAVRGGPPGQTATVVPWSDTDPLGVPVVSADRTEAVPVVPPSSPGGTPGVAPPAASPASGSTQATPAAESQRSPRRNPRRAGKPRP
jgi:uncharacterized membrane protein